MDFDDVINKRYSVRGYLDKEIEDEKLEYVLKAATIAPKKIIISIISPLISLYEE